MGLVVGEFVMIRGSSVGSVVGVKVGDKVLNGVVAHKKEPFYLFFGRGKTRVVSHFLVLLCRVQNVSLCLQDYSPSRLILHHQNIARR